jgi:pyrimidine operon attenuation protein / uracil phosphoribosyltransferase
MDRVKNRLMDDADLGRTLDRLARQVIELIDVDTAEQPPAVVGMQTRGVHLARRLIERIRTMEAIDLPMGVLDATMYRDDYRMRRHQPIIRMTDIPFDVRGRDIILVDDVLYTGRTARAALDALMDLGRPASVRFLAIIDRGHRELPICADLIGRTVYTLEHEEVRVRLREIDEEDGVDLVETDALED